MEQGGGPDFIVIAWFIGMNDTVAPEEIYIPRHHGYFCIVHLSGKYKFFNDGLCYSVIKKNLVDQIAIYVFRILRIPGNMIRSPFCPSVGMMTGIRAVSTKES